MDTSLIVGLLLAALGICAVAAGIFTHIRATASRSWPSVRGKIVTCRLHAMGDSEEPDKWRVEVAYEYEVGGVPYTGTTVAPGQDFVTVSGRSSLMVADRFPLHSMVPVYYDPEKPSRALLEPGETKHALAMVGVGVLLGIVGLVAALR